MTDGEVYVPRLLQFQEIWKKHERAHWNIDEIDLRTDIEQWRSGKISDEAKANIKMTLRLFTQSDKDVCCAYVDRLLPVFKQADVRFMLLSFAARETTHTLGYRHLNTSLGYDTEAFASEFLQYEALVAKHDFMIAESDMTKSMGIAKYLAKQIMMEGINLFGPFVNLLAYRLGGLIPGTVDVNAWSIADESIHVEGNTALLMEFLRQNPEVVTDEWKAYVYKTYHQLIEIELATLDLIDSAGSNPCLELDNAKSYIKYLGDYRLMQMGLKPQFNIKEDPCPWVAQITGNTVGNFFERTIIEYSKGSLTGDWVY